MCVLVALGAHLIIVIILLTYQVLALYVTKLVLHAGAIIKINVHPAIILLIYYQILLEILVWHHAQLIMLFLIEILFQCVKY